MFTRGQYTSLFLLAFQSLGGTYVIPWTSLSTISCTKTSSIRQSAIIESEKIIGTERPVQSQSQNYDKIENVVSAIKQTRQSSESSFARKFVDAWRNAMNGDTSTLSHIVQPDAKWDNPLCSSATEYISALKGLSEFVIDPSLTLLSHRHTTSSGAIKNIIEIEFLLSFWYPMFWRPRIVIPGRAIVEYTTTTIATASLDDLVAASTVTSVHEIWDQPALPLFLQQFLPRGWDIVHLFTTPTPERQVTRHLGKVDGVDFVQLPAGLYAEIRWRGLAENPGPPLQVLPDFTLFGELNTNKQNREVYYCVLPAEVRSGRFMCPTTGQLIKVSTWLLPVPTTLHDTVLRSEAVAGLGDAPVYRQLPSPLIVSQEINGDDSEVNEDTLTEADYQVGLESDGLAVLASLTKGTLRGDLPGGLDYERIDSIQRAEHMEVAYRVLPSRVLIQADVRGEPTAEKVSEAFEKVKKAVASKEADRILGRSPQLLTPASSDYSYTYELGNRSNIESLPSYTSAPWLGLKLHNTKVCFNSRGQPAMAVYEQQFGGRLTTVHAEIAGIAP